MFNRTKMADILEDLRRDIADEEKKTGVKTWRMSFKKLSEAIKNKTGIDISNTALWEYENPDGQKKMSVENLCALADYYGVSTDYLLGLTEEKTPDIEIQAVIKMLGLSEEAIDNIRLLNTLPLVNCEETFDEKRNVWVANFENEWMDVLSEMLSANHLIEFLPFLLLSIKEYRALQNEKTTGKISEPKFWFQSGETEKYDFELWRTTNAAKEIIFDVIKGYSTKTKDGARVYSRDLEKGKSKKELKELWASPCFIDNIQRIVDDRNKSTRKVATQNDNVEEQSKSE